MKHLTLNTNLSSQTLALALLFCCSIYSLSASAQLGETDLYYQYDGYNPKPVAVTASKYVKYPTSNFSNEDVIEFVSNHGKSASISHGSGK